MEVTTDSSSAAVRSPSKPKPTQASLEVLVAHYNAQLPAYNEAVARFAACGLPADQILEPIGEDAEPLGKAEVILLIRRQNLRLKRFIRPRALELLQEVVGTREADGRTLGRSYEEVLEVLATEFPEGSTSAAALRWYVVHSWSEAEEEGLTRPKMPQVRPRSRKKAA